MLVKIKIKETSRELKKKQKKKRFAPSHMKIYLSTLL
jgi:hypothetical protein